MRRLPTTLLLLVVHSPGASADYFAAPDVHTGSDGAESVSGTVFDDADRDGVRDPGEPGVPGVLVSNGLDWATTDDDGGYRIQVRDDMNLTIVQPRGWRVPTDDRRLPRFFYVHKPGGSPRPLRFGGLPDTGPAPERVDFPLARRESDPSAFTCAVVGDSQTYSNREIGWLRDGAVTDIVANAPDCVLYVGDVVGDDLELIDRLVEVGSAAGAPQWLVHGNHDLDFDARSDADSADSWRRIVGPEYYAFERGDVLFVVLDNVVYPCGEAPEDAARAFCGDPEWPTYNGRIDDVQMRWLAGLLERTPRDRLVVVATHIPLVSFADPESRKHQTDNAAAVHELLAGRPALSLSGHTHTIENHAPGQHFRGWREAAGVDALPFRHIVAGAASGAWYQGDFNIDGNPMALQRMGAPNGVLMLEFDGVDYRERYVGARIDPERAMWLGLNTPGFRHWYNEIMAWRDRDEADRHPLPPYSVNDLPDSGIVTSDDLVEGVWLTANVWAGSAETVVTAVIGGERGLTLRRTQTGRGDTPNIGAEWADPFAARRQLSVARYAFVSRNGEARNQGFELFRGNDYGPAAPMPQRAVADRNVHLWRARLPADLVTGVHRIDVTSTNRHGRESRGTLIVEVRDQRPTAHFRKGPWEDE